MTMKEVDDYIRDNF